MRACPSGGWEVSEAPGKLPGDFLKLFKDLEFFDSVFPNMPDTVAVLALKYLSDYMSRYYDQKVLSEVYSIPLLRRIPIWSGH